MTPRVSIIIAIADYHKELSARAVASAQAQTEPCVVITAYDEQGRGAGYARNRAFERVETEFTVFLDADDWVEPTFCAECLAVWRPGTYVYSDWLEEETVKSAPDKAWCDGQWHVLTSLIPTDAIRKAGGFDQSLPAAEDTALYWQLVRGGLCGVHLKKPLFHYGKEGRRAKAFVNGPEYQPVMQYIQKTYGGVMGCCGGNEPIVPDGPKCQPGDVVAQAMWAGNRQERGMQSGRLYERTSYPKQLCVDPQDARARPDLFRMIEYTLPVAVPRPAYVAQINALPVAPQIARAPVAKAAPQLLQGIEQVAEALWHVNVPPPPMPLEQMVAIKPAAVKPDVAGMLRLAQSGP